MHFIAWFLLSYWIQRGADGAVNKPHTLWTLFTQPKNWNEAELLCEMRGGHLADVNSETTYQILKYLLGKEPWSSNIKTGNATVGLYLPVSGSFPSGKWVPGGSANILNVSLNSLNRCAGVSKIHGLRATTCSQRTAFICEKALGNQSSGLYNEVLKTNAPNSTKPLTEPKTTANGAECVQMCDSHQTCSAAARSTSGSCHLYEEPVNHWELDPDFTLFEKERKADCPYKVVPGEKLASGTHFKHLTEQTTDQTCKQKCDEFEDCWVAARHGKEKCNLYNVSMADIVQMLDDPSSTLFIKLCYEGYEADVSHSEFEWMKVETYTGDPLTTSDGDGKVYTLVNERTDWGSAEEHCSKIGQRLAGEEFVDDITTVQNIVKEYYEETYHVIKRGSHWVNIRSSDCESVDIATGNPQGDTQGLLSLNSIRLCQGKRFQELSHGNDYLDTEIVMEVNQWINPFTARVPCMTMLKRKAVSKHLLSLTGNWTECRHLCNNTEGCKSFTYLIYLNLCGLFSDFSGFFPSTDWNGWFDIHRPTCVWAVLQEPSASATVTTTPITDTTPPTTTTTTPPPTTTTKSSTTATTPPTTTATPPLTATTPPTTTTSTTATTPATTTTTPPTTATAPPTTTTTPPLTATTPPTTTTMPPTTSKSPRTTTTTPPPTIATPPPTAITPPTTTTTPSTTATTPPTTTTTPPLTATTPLTTTTTPPTTTTSPTTMPPTTTTSAPTITTTPPLASTTPPTTATTSATSSSAPSTKRKPCFCNCGRPQFNATVNSSKVLEEMQKQVEQLSIEKKSTHKNKIKRISAPDQRTSSMVIGTVCTGVLFGVLGLIVLSDLYALVKAFHNRWWVSSSSVSPSTNTLLELEARLSVAGNTAVCNQEDSSL